jgi:drug/metabolite transporter (DMT)-like permease
MHLRQAGSWSVVATTGMLLATTVCCGGFTFQNNCARLQLHPKRKNPPSKGFHHTVKGYPSNHEPARRRHQHTSTTTSLRTQINASITPYPSWVYMSLLALQFGFQPILTKLYTPSSIIRSTVVLAQDLVRMLTAAFLLVSSGALEVILEQWTLSGAIMGAGLPAALYLVQNYCTIMAYQNLAPVTFNVLNQTKTLSAAVCVFLIMGKIQSPLQILSLFVLLVSALVIEKVVPLNPWQTKQTEEPAVGGTTSEKRKSRDDMDQSKNHFRSGVVPVLLASFISGLGKVVCGIGTSKYSYYASLYCHCFMNVLPPALS